ncbi:MAG: thioesterase family protein [Ardenticatenaceae bacterium]|nr:thioesterase family protein [Anaerolineales bacterium]MCB8916433.1 thioesterase family protein [Ardenticatenaceae bacterium]
MPQIHERTFRVRLYECDAYGHVNHANYVRYMQETAFDATAAVGYDLAWYNAAGKVWNIRETDITYHKPLKYGDSVTVTTWVQNFRRVRSRRNYELRHTASGELVAVANSDWVFLDRQTRRPTSVPPEMMAAFIPEGSPARPARRPPFPQPPPPPPGVFTITRPVVWADVDLEQHVNNAMYLTYLEECGTQLCDHYGWPMPRMVAAGYAILHHQYRLEYLAPAVLGDDLHIATWVSNLRRATGLRHYTIHRASDGLLLLRARLQWVWSNVHTGQPIRVPDEILADFAPNFVW